MAFPSTAGGGLERDSIASHGLACRELFTKCTENLESSNQSLNLKEYSKRYDLWAKNIAAHHQASLPSSLEFRIKDDRNACKIVKKALNYLAESLEIILSILKGEKENETWDSTSELEELDLAVQEGLTNLFELSMIIRKKPEKDEYIKASLASSFDPTPDIVHVGDKYPLTRDNNVWLKERLGTAITRRRQYLRYRKEHQEKMEQMHEMKTNADGKTVWSGEKASTYLPESIFGKNTPITPMPLEMSSTGAGKRPQTEYADSSRGKDGSADLLRTPLLPKDPIGVRVEYGQYFECPYCRRPQNVRDKNEWKKHIFSDLRPYVCTFESCGLNMFESQNQWFNHELHFHRKLWKCTFCEEATLHSRPDLETHMGSEHVDEVQENNMESLLDNCAISRIDATCCPLCTTYGSRLQSINQSNKCDISLKQFQEHLGRHMEQLALAALPEDEADGNETADEDEEQTRYSIRYWPHSSLVSEGPAAGGRLKKLDFSKQPEKKPGFFGTLFRRTKRDEFDDARFKVLDFPEIPGEESRQKDLEMLRARQTGDLPGLRESDDEEQRKSLPPITTPITRRTTLEVPQPVYKAGPTRNESGPSPQIPPQGKNPSADGNGPDANEASSARETFEPVMVAGSRNSSLSVESGSTMYKDPRPSSSAPPRPVPRPELQEFWQCDVCEREVQHSTWGNSCPDCSHTRCDTCTWFQR